MYSEASIISPVERAVSLSISVALPLSVVIGLALLIQTTHDGGQEYGRLTSIDLPSAPAPEPKRSEQAKQKSAPKETKQNAKTAPAKPRVAQPMRVTPIVQPVTSTIPVRPSERMTAPAVPLSRQSSSNLGQSSEIRVQRASGSNDSTARFQKTSASNNGQPSRFRDTYGQRVYREIKQGQSYERVLARDGVTGTVVLEFQIDARGQLRSERIGRSSGNAIIDQLALQQLRATAPFARPPGGRMRSFSIPLTYRPKE